MCTCSFIFFYTNCIRKLKIQVQIQRSVQSIANSLQLYYYFPLSSIVLLQPAHRKFPKDRVNVNIGENYGRRISKTKHPGSSLDLHDIDLNNELVGGGGWESMFETTCTMQSQYTVHSLRTIFYIVQLYTIYIYSYIVIL